MSTRAQCLGLWQILPLSVIFSLCVNRCICCYQAELCGPCLCCQSCAFTPYEHVCDTQGQIHGKQCIPFSSSPFHLCFVCVDASACPRRLRCRAHYFPRDLLMSATDDVAWNFAQECLVHRGVSALRQILTLLVSVAPPFATV